jgi:hypothetical protein
MKTLVVDELLLFTLRFKFDVDNKLSKKYWEKPARPYAPTIIEFDGEMFLWFTAMGNFQMYFWMVIVGGQTEANKYHYNFKLTKLSSNDAVEDVVSWTLFH